MGETVATLLSLVSLTRETLDSALLLKVLLGEISFSSENIKNYCFEGKKLISIQYL